MKRVRQRVISPRLLTWAGLLCLILAAAGCKSDDGGACVSDGPSSAASFRVLTPGCADSDFCGEGYQWASSGDATVLEVQPGPSNSFAVTLHFAQDATDVTVDLRLPGTVPLPLDIGDVVDAHVQLSVDQWQEVWVTVRASDGAVLLKLIDLALPSDTTTPTCHSDVRECGSIGYPTLTARHPEDDPTISVGPTAELRQGDSATLTWEDTTYTAYLLEAWIYTDPLCADQPPGRLRSILVRRFD